MIENVDAPSTIRATAHTANALGDVKADSIPHPVKIKLTANAVSFISVPFSLLF